MKPHLSRKQFWTIVCILLLAELLTILLVKQWKYLFPSHEVSELYQHYATLPDIEASFVKDYRIDDTTFVDVTFLQAKTDSAWHLLQKDFNIPVIPKEYESKFLKDSNQVWVKLAPKDNPTLRPDSILTNNNEIITSYWKHSISVFHLTDAKIEEKIYSKEFVNKNLKDK